MLNGNSPRGVHLLQNAALVILNLAFLPTTCLAVLLAFLFRLLAGLRTAGGQIAPPVAQKTVLVTGVGMTKGLTLARHFHQAGHKVIGLARSEKSAAALEAKGAEAIRGSIEDIESLKRGANESDGVINLAFNHDFTKYEDNIKAELNAVKAIGSTLVGTNKPFVITLGTLVLPKGQLAAEDAKINYEDALNARAICEREVDSLASQGVRASVVRLSPTVHGPGDRAFIYMLAQIAREKGVSAYIGEGLNRWPAVHRLDAARLFRLAVEKGTPGARYHAVAEEEIPRTPRG